MNNKFKVKNSGEKVSAFGGFNFVFNSFLESGLSSLIDREIGIRGSGTGFRYSDIFANQLAVYFNGGDCTEDLSDHLKSHLQQVRGMNVCSPDTVLRGGKELSCSSVMIENPSSGVVHEFNINTKLNDLMVKALVLTGQLERERKYDLDYDNVVLANEKYDSAKTYKKTRGYQPGVATIANHPVYIEGRNGNSQAKYKQDDTIERAFCNLRSNGIRIGRFRADSASYQQSVIKVVESNADTFYIRAKRCAAMDERIGGLSGWRKIRLGIQEMEVVDIDDYMPFRGEKKYRLVISRIRRRDGQADIFSGEAYTYRAIITNDLDMDSSQVISFYNARGESEKVFDVMNNDFGWSAMPYSFLSENTAFMIMTAIYANFYSYIIAEYSKKLQWLKSNFRLKKFIFRFITVAAKWIRTGRQHVLKLYTEKNYSPLLT
jgi:hypothetical protein